MRTTTLTLLLSCLAIAAAPAAEAHERRHDRHEARVGHDRSGPRDLAFRIERAAEAFLRDVRHEVGRVDRREARALRAAKRLERATDALAREARERHLDRGFTRDLARVSERFDVVRDRVHALPRSRALRRDLRRMDHMIHELEERVDRHRRFAADGRGFHPGDGGRIGDDGHARSPHHDRRDRYARR